MTIASLLIGIITSQVLFVITKVFFFRSLDLGNGFVIALLYLTLAIITIAVVRRLGILNYVEAIFLAIVWLIVSLLVDVAITASIVGFDIYKTWSYWLTLLMITLVVISCHKKQHVEVRKASK